jgi:SAF domain
MADSSTSAARAGQTPLGVGVAPRRQRRWSLALVAALVVLASALAFAVLWMNAGDRKPVLALARDIDAGEVVADADLDVVRVAADPGVELVSAEDRDAVVGQTALVDMAAGSLLTLGQVGESSTLEEGMAIVGVAVDPAEMPDSGLRTGNRVSIVQTATSSDIENVDDEDEDLIVPAEVLGVEIAVGTVHGIDSSDDLQGQIVVSVLVERDLAARIAGASAAGEASLVLIP